MLLFFQGVCIKVSTTTVERLWDLIDKISVNFLSKLSLFLIVFSFDILVVIHC